MTDIENIKFVEISQFQLILQAPLLGPTVYIYIEIYKLSIKLRLKEIQIRRGNFGIF
jgi:hypothetical protein